VFAQVQFAEEKYVKLIHRRVLIVVSQIGWIDQGQGEQEVDVLQPDWRVGLEGIERLRLTHVDRFSAGVPFRTASYRFSQDPTKYANDEGCIKGNHVYNLVQVIVGDDQQVTQVPIELSV